jgi:hypothetical protein
MTNKIIMWSGDKSNIPDGWVICDGNNGTPDLTRKMVRGAVSDSEINTSISSQRSINVEDHEHFARIATNGLLGSEIKGYDEQSSYDSGGMTNETKSVHSFPSHTKMIYIMKL